MRPIAFTLPSFALCLLLPVCNGQTAPQLVAPPTRVAPQKLVSDDLAAGDIYGAAVAVDRDVAVVASEYDDDNGTDSGSVWIYRYTDGSWNAEQKLKPGDGTTGDNFGRSVTIQGDVVAVGTHWDDDQGSKSGSVYVFRYDGDTWVEEQKLLPIGGTTEDRFGNSVCLDGDVLGVCGWLADPLAGASGAAWMFRYDGNSWVEEQKLAPIGGGQGDNFGRYIAISSGVAVIGAWKADPVGNDSGAAYVFRFNGTSWVQEQELNAPDGAAGDLFGWATGIDGRFIAVGSHADDDLGADSGSVYVFRRDRNEWVFEQKLLPSDGHAGGWFGYALEVDQNQILIGATANFAAANDPGSAYIFRRVNGAWKQVARLVPPDGAPQDKFGFHVAMHASTALVGAWRDDDAGNDSGSAYIWTGTGQQSSRAKK